jgi:hypothetical protein
MSTFLTLPFLMTKQGVGSDNHQKSWLRKGKIVDIKIKVVGLQGPE